MLQGAEHTPCPLSCNSIRLPAAGCVHTHSDSMDMSLTSKSETLSCFSDSNIMVRVSPLSSALRVMMSSLPEHQHVRAGRAAWDQALQQDMAYTIHFCDNHMPTSQCKPVCTH
jgi:hypothetical protein